MKSCICMRTYIRIDIMDEDEIFARFAEWEKNLLKETVFYIYYDPSTGNIVHFRNQLVADELPFIEVTNKDLEDIENIDLNKYVVITRLDQKVIIKRAFDSIDSISNIDDMIYRIPSIVLTESLDVPEQDYYSYDLLIEQDLIKNEVRFRFSNDLRQQFKTPIFQEKTVDLFLTNPQDPNILHSIYSVSLFDLCNHWYYTLPLDNYDGELRDFYTKRYFTNYIHMIIKEK